eukprot:4946562-Pyramimonas_sp.AAC.1
MPNWASGRHADGPTGGFGGAPCRAMMRCTGWVKSREEGGGEGRREEERGDRLFKTRTQHHKM